MLLQCSLAEPAEGHTSPGLHLVKRGESQLWERWRACLFGDVGEESTKTSCQLAKFGSSGSHGNVPVAAPQWFTPSG